MSMKTFKQNGAQTPEQRAVDQAITDDLIELLAKHKLDALVLVGWRDIGVVHLAMMRPSSEWRDSAAGLSQGIAELLSEQGSTPNFRSLQGLYRDD